MGAHLDSQVCSSASLSSEPLVRWAERLRPAWDRERSRGPAPVHRKLWEWFFIAAALEERGMLRPGRRGVGFGVGREPLVAAFAATGCELLATDQAPEDAASGGWAATEQYAGALDALNELGLCDPAEFSRLTSFRVVDMREIPEDVRGFDFSWSSCSFEHLGDLGAGLRFLIDQMDCLRPGGVGVHTTEFNVSSDDETIAEGDTVLYRRRDLEWVAGELRRRGHEVRLDFTLGTTPDDTHVDSPPWSGSHLRLALGGFVTTSYALVVVKGGAARPRRPGRLRRAERR